MSTARRMMMRSGGDGVDWKALFMGLVDGSLSGEIHLSSDITYIKPYCFANCANLTSVNAPNVVGLGNNAFYSDTGLKTVNIGVLQSIGASVFLNCKSLETPIIIGNSVTELGGSVFLGCNKILYVDVGAGVTRIGGQCFRYNNYMQYVIMRPTSPPTLGDLNFNSSNPLTYPIYVPDASVAAYKAASGWSDLADRIKPLSEFVES